MIKSIPGERKTEDSLRPLTEREIQQKLYGSYFPEQTAVKEIGKEETPETSWKKRPLFETSQKRRSLTLPRIAVKFPWAAVLSLIRRALSRFWSLAKFLFPKVATGWGAGILIVVAVFLGIHSLNAYRATAMKNSKVLSRPDAPRKREVQRPRREIKQGVPAVVTPAWPANMAPPTPQIQAPRMPEPTSALADKSYVVQVCTYGREEDARRLVKQLTQTNLRAFFQPFQRPNGRTFYLVFLGRFKSFSEARAKLKDFQGKPVAKDFPDSFVRNL